MVDEQVHISCNAFAMPKHKLQSCQSRSAFRQWNYEVSTSVIKAQISWLFS